MRWPSSLGIIPSISLVSATVRNRDYHVRFRLPRKPRAGCRLQYPGCRDTRERVADGGEQLGRGVGARRRAAVREVTENLDSQPAPSAP